MKIDKRLFRYTCPCCGYPALSLKAGYDYCFVCGWEDDGQDDDSRTDILSSSNYGLTLGQARANFEKIGRFSERCKEDKEIDRLKKKIMQLYEFLMQNPGEISHAEKELSAVYKEYKERLGDKKEPKGAKKIN